MAYSCGNIARYFINRDTEYIGFFNRVSKVCEPIANGRGSPKYRPAYTIKILHYVYSAFS